MNDSALMLRAAAAGNLTADEAETTHIVDLGPGGTSINGVDVWLLVPSDSGTDTLVATVYGDDTAALSSPDEVLGVFKTITGGTDTFPLVRTIHISTRRRYIGLKLDVTDTGGGVNFGAVQAGVTIGYANPGGARP